MTRFQKLLLRLLLAGICLAADNLRAGETLKEALIPIFLHDTTPVGQVRVQLLRSENERRGFYRVGVLPMVVAENVRLELRNASRWQEFFQALPKTFAQRPRAELRQVAWATGSDQPPFLQTKRMRFESADAYKLWDVILHQDGKELHIASAVFYVEGPQRGCLIDGSKNVHRIFPRKRSSL